MFLKNALDRELILRRHGMFVVDTIGLVVFDVRWHVGIIRTIALDTRYGRIAIL
jgi:hypothetical protein